MANTRDITGANSNILLIGDGGTWKTRFMRTVPDIFVYDFDMGMVSLRDSAVEYETFKDLDRGVPATPAYEKLGLYQYGAGWMKFWNHVQKLGEEISRGKGPKAIGLDSLTFMSMLAVDKILTDENKGLSLPHQGTWGAHHQYFKTIFSQLTALPVRLIATAHVERKENDLTQVVEKLPLLAGKMAPMISTFFDEVYYTEVIDDPKEKDTNGRPKKISIIHTQQTTALRSAKSRWNVPDGTLTDFAAIEPYLGNNPNPLPPPPKGPTPSVPSTMKL